MILRFRQRFFSWFDSYDIFDENEETVYTVQGQLAWGHLLKIYDSQGRELGTVKEEIFTLLPRFSIYRGDTFLGCIKKKFSIVPRFDIEYNGWSVDGDFWGWNYTIRDSSGREVATLTKELFHWTDVYVMDIHNPEDALSVLMFALAMDAQKCSSSS